MQFFEGICVDIGAQIVPPVLTAQCVLRFMVIVSPTADGKQFARAITKQVGPEPIFLLQPISSRWPGSKYSPRSENGLD